MHWHKADDQPLHRPLIMRINYHVYHVNWGYLFKQSWWQNLAEFMTLIHYKDDILPMKEDRLFSTIRFPTLVKQQSLSLTKYSRCVPVEFHLLGWAYLLQVKFLELMTAQAQRTEMSPKMSTLGISDSHVYHCIPLGQQVFIMDLIINHPIETGKSPLASSFLLALFLVNLYCHP